MKYDNIVVAIYRYSRWRIKMKKVLLYHQVKSQKGIWISITCPVIFQAVYDPYQIIWAVLLDSVDLFKFCASDDITDGHQGDSLF